MVRLLSFVPLHRVLLAVAAGMLPAALAQGPMPGIASRAAVATLGMPDMATAGGPHEFTRAADGLFYVDIKVNGAPVHFLVDTGASVVTLTPADARKVGAPVEERHYNAHVETASGKTAMAWTTLDHVAIAGREVRTLRAAVVREGLGVSLLGQNLLSQLGSVTIEGDRLKLR